MELFGATNSRRKGYMPLAGIPSSFRSWINIKPAAIIAILITLILLLKPLASSGYYTSYAEGIVPPHGSIPNIVHYVYLKTGPDAVFNFHFAHFITLYASVMYIRPTRVFIHTDYSEEEFAEAAANGNTWTRKVPMTSTFAKASMLTI
jgi:hypothetical protein